MGIAVLSVRAGTTFFQLHFLNWRTIFTSQRALSLIIFFSKKVICWLFQSCFRAACELSRDLLGPWGSMKFGTFFDQICFLRESLDVFTFNANLIHESLVIFFLAIYRIFSGDLCTCIPYWICVRVSPITYNPRLIGDIHWDPLEDLSVYPLEISILY